ncbi:MAG: phage major capsid protein [Thermomicrobiales bacterium]
MSKLVEYRERMTAALMEMKGLSEKEARSEADESRLDALIAETNDLGPKVDREVTIAAQVKRSTEYTQPAGTRASGLIPIGEGEDTSGQDGGSRRIDRRSIGQRFIESDALKDYRRHPAGKSDAVDVGSFFPTAEQRALLTTTGQPSDLIVPQRVPGIFQPNEAPLTMRDILLSGQTQSDAVLFLRELAFTNSAAEVAEATSITTGAKPESGITFEQATAPVATIAHWIPITRQTLEDVAQMRSYVEQRLVIGLQRREDNQFLNGNGTGGNLTGILNTTGIQVLDDVVTTGYFAVNPVRDAGTPNENFNRIMRAKTQISITGDAMANFVVLHPRKVEQFLTTTDTTRQYLGGGPFNPTGTPNLWGTRVVVSENIAETVALVGDGTLAQVWDRMSAQVYVTDSHSDFFIRNIFVLLAEERVALTVYRPAAFAKVSLVA